MRVNPRLRWEPGSIWRERSARLSLDCIPAGGSTRVSTRGASSSSETGHDATTCSDDEGNDDDSATHVGDYSILDPFIIGFGHSRPGTPGALSEPGAATGVIRHYTHPAYNETSPLQKYRYEFEYYSLAVVLIEIGHWTPLDVLLRGTSDSAGGIATGLTRSVEHVLVGNLSGLVGDVYQGVVHDLFALFDRGDSDGHLVSNEPVDLASLLSVQTGVLEALGTCHR